jgi:hypothetical protein
MKETQEPRHKFTDHPHKGTSKNVFFITHPNPCATSSFKPDFVILAGRRALYSGREGNNRSF